MHSAYSGKKWIVLFREEMNSVYSRKKCIKIVLIQGRNEYGLFGEEMNNVYSVKKWIVLIQERNV